MLERLIHAQNRLIQALQAEVGRLQTRGGVSLFGKSDKESIVVDIFAVLSQTGIKPSSDALGVLHFRESPRKYITFVRLLLETEKILEH